MAVLRQYTVLNDFELNYSLFPPRWIHSINYLANKCKFLPLISMDVQLKNAHNLIDFKVYFPRYTLHMTHSEIGILKCTHLRKLAQNQTETVSIFSFSEHTDNNRSDYWEIHLFAHNTNGVLRNACDTARTQCCKAQQAYENCVVSVLYSAGLHKLRDEHTVHWVRLTSN